jgi:uncharacterized surface protein with fasciclin (FAS1) repeats
MKHTVSFFSSFISIFLFSILFVSCKKDEDIPEVKLSTLKAEIANRSDLSLMDLSVQKSGLSSKLDSAAASLTLFAPTNDAFAASKIDATLINSLSLDQLKEIVLYHTIDVKYLSSELPDGPNAKVTTASGDSVFVTKNSSGVYINGIKVQTANIMASNGVLHTISKVLVSPVGNLVEAILADTTLSYLAAAVVRASQGNVNVAALLSSGGVFTVFAPTNQAFRNAGFATVNDINAADPNVLSSILTYHVLAGRVFSSDLTEGAQPTTLAGGSVTISLVNGATVKGSGNTSSSNIIGTNIMGSNGVIHLIDRVLLKQ